MEPLAARGAYGGSLTTTAIITALALLLTLAACKPVPDPRPELPQADAARGRAVMERVGCGACHSIPGVWPNGRAGPSLEAFAGQGLIAGRLPNRPDILTAFVADAPRLLPGTAMPAMPLTEEEARDVAAYLYTLDGR